MTLGKKGGKCPLCSPLATPLKYAVCSSIYQFGLSTLWISYIYVGTCICSSYLALFIHFVKCMLSVRCTFSYCCRLYVTIHEKTMHNALELRPPLPTTTFELLLPCSHGDMSKNVPGSPVLEYCKKLQWTLLCTLHAEVRILAVYGKYVAPPTKSMS